jgi:hypothetical protein
VRDLALRAWRRGIPTVVLTVSDCDDHDRRIARAAAEDCTAWAAHFGADAGWLSFEPQTSVMMLVSPGSAGLAAY